MKFRPCIDIHGGKVKQIVGSSIGKSAVQENYVSEQDASYYASLYKEDGASGGHIILLDKPNSEAYKRDLIQAQEALRVFSGGMQIGGGMNSENALNFIKKGASHVIITSYVFDGDDILWEHIAKLKSAVGKEHIVFDLSCRRVGNKYYIVTNRWQNITDIEVNSELFEMLAEHCDEFLVHAVDAEGLSDGIEVDLVKLLGHWHGIPVTYAGGVKSFEDIDKIKNASDGKLDFTIGSSLNLFGGQMDYKKVLEYCS